MALIHSEVVVQFVNQRIADLLRAPDGWGPPHAVELQLLLLIEVLHVASGSPPGIVDGVMERFDRYIGTRVPGPPLPLALRLGLQDEANTQFIDLLHGFLQSERLLKPEQLPFQDRRVILDAVAPKFPTRLSIVTKT